MPDEWHVAGRKGRSRVIPSFVQPDLFATAASDHSHKAQWTCRPTSAIINLPVASLALNDAAFVRLQQKIANRAKEVSTSLFLQGFKRLLEYVEHQEILNTASGEGIVKGAFSLSTATEFVVYGLGSPSAGARAVHSQLAFLALLQPQLPSLKRTVAFDPVFSTLDKTLLQTFHIEVLKENNSAGYVVTGPTLFYMPHCDCHLYNNLLKANWSPQQLCKVAILGNSFHSYAQRWGQKPKQNSPDCPHELLAVSASGTAVELPVSEAEFPVTSAFNDLSLHFFPEWKISRQESGPRGISPDQITC